MRKTQKLSKTLKQTFFFDTPNDIFIDTPVIKQLDNNMLSTFHLQLIVKVIVNLVPQRLSGNNNQFFHIFLNSLLNLYLIQFLSIIGYFFSSIKIHVIL